MRTIRFVGLAGMLSLLVGLWSQPGFAFSYVMPSDESLYQQSEGVLVATIAEELDPDFDSRLPQRRYKLAVERVLAGVPFKGDVVLRMPGTRPDAERRLFLPGVPEVQLGERVLVFFGSGVDGELRPMQLSLGLFFETLGQDGKRAYVRALDDAEQVGGKRANEAYQWPRDAEHFEQWIAAGGRGTAFSYLRANYGKAITRDAKFNMISSGTGNPIRWFAFESAGAVNWQAKVGQPIGSTFSVDTAMSAGLAAWVGDPDSRIDMRYIATRVASDPGNDSNNGVNAVVWDDPGNDIAGSYACGNLTGILGLGGTFFTSTTRAFDGTDYHESMEGFLITQDLAGCYFGSSVTRAAEVLAHEFGHTLGFAHSCGDPGLESCVGNAGLNDATMRGQIHDDQRGAVLRADDSAGALRVYPSPNYVHPLERQVNGLSTGMSGCVGTGSRDASSSADGRVIVFQTTCTVVGKAGGGSETIMMLDRSQCAAQLRTKAGDARCSEKNWTRYTKGVPVDEGIEPSITANGGFAVFAAPTGSVTTQAIPSDKRFERETKGTGWAVYMRNLVSNIAFQVAGGMSAGTGTQPQLSPDGLTITFVSDSQLPGVETTGGGTFDATPDVFQIKPIGGDPGNGFFAPVCASCKDAIGQPAGPPAVSANGGTAAYSLGNALWLTNMVNGTSSVMVSAAMGVSTLPSMDYAGNNIVFQTSATGLDPEGSDNNGKPDIYTFEACCNKFTRISQPDVDVGTSELDSVQPTISGDGQNIAFVSAAQNLMGFTPEPNSNDNVYVYNTLNRLKRRYSRASDGIQQSNNDSARPYLSYNGSMMLFDSAASNFDGVDANGVQDVFQLPNPLAEFVVFRSGFD